jgi:drug/metabolite transporter (DMT)-like permease
MPRYLAVLMLLICTMFWGFAFIAQKQAMDSIGPLVFAASRYLLGGIAILPIALWEYRRKRATLAAQGSTATPMTRQNWLYVLVLSVVFFLGSWLQQVGLIHTTVTNGGFLTSLYVLFVPLIAFLAVRTKPHPVIWVGVPLALIGIYFLNGGGFDSFNYGDMLIVVCAVFWAMHVLMLSHIARKTGLPIFISAISFLVAAALATAFAFWLEVPSLASIQAAAPQILYSGILSTGVAFTLQAVGQQYVPPANAAIILSAESLFAGLGGALLLGERLPPIGYAGAALIFGAIILVEAVPALMGRKEETHLVAN